MEFRWDGISSPVVHGSLSRWPGRVTKRALDCVWADTLNAHLPSPRHDSQRTRRPGDSGHACRHPSVHARVCARGPAELPAPRPRVLRRHIESGPVEYTTARRRGEDRPRGVRAPCSPRAGRAGRAGRGPRGACGAGGDRVEAPVGRTRVPNVPARRRGVGVRFGEPRVRRCVRIWLITDAWVINALIRMTPWQDGHASGSTSVICRASAAHRRLASVGASRRRMRRTGHRHLRRPQRVMRAFLDERIPTRLWPRSRT